MMKIDSLSGVYTKKVNYQKLFTFALVIEEHIEYVLYLISKIEDNTVKYRIKRHYEINNRKIL